MNTTRRDVMKRAGQAVAAGAALSIVPFPVERSDTALFDLCRQWDLAFKIREERVKAWRDAADEHMPPEYRQCPTCEIPVQIYDAAFTAPHVKALSALWKQAEAEMPAIKNRIAETPARTIGGIAAKLRIGIPRYLGDPQGKSRTVFLMETVLADAERLAGRSA